MKVINIDRRLKALEKTVGNLNKVYPGAQFVGRYYDELTHEERYLWLKYYYSLSTNEVDVKAYEEVMTYFNECPEQLHFICGKREKPPTQEEFEERVNEVRQYMEELINEERN